MHPVKQLVGKTSSEQRNADTDDNAGLYRFGIQVMGEG